MEETEFIEEHVPEDKESISLWWLIPIVLIAITISIGIEELVNKNIFGTNGYMTSADSNAIKIALSHNIDISQDIIYIYQDPSVKKIDYIKLSDDLIFKYYIATTRCSKYYQVNRWSPLCKVIDREFDKLNHPIDIKIDTIISKSVTSPPKDTIVCKIEQKIYLFRYSDMTWYIETEVWTYKGNTPITLEDANQQIYPAKDTSQAKRDQYNRALGIKSKIDKILK